MNFDPREDETGPMNDRGPDVIAQAGGYRVLEDGTTEYLHERAGGVTWGAPVRLYQADKDVLALLADAAKRAREDVDDLRGTVREQFNVENRGHRSLADRVAALEAETASMRTLALSSERRKEDDRVFQASTHRALDDILDRLAAVEGQLRADESGFKLDVENITRRLDHCMHSVATLDRRGQELGNRMSALEFRQSQHSEELNQDGLAIDSLRDQVSVLEARQQDELPGEPFPDIWKQGEGTTGAMDTRTRPQCVADGDAEASYRSGWHEGRLKLAREISGGLLRDYPYSNRAELERIGDWIEREYGEKA